MQARADVKPVLKWAGGKRQLLEPILAFVERAFPDQIEKYYEPFAGGGAVFFALVARGKFKRARLSDKNEDLIRVYSALRDDAVAVIHELEKLCQQKLSEATYYKVRASRPTKVPERAARMLYLNRTGYNGLYRVNRSGEHERLAKTFAKLTTKGVAALLSNSDTPETRKLYAAFDTHTVHAKRAINSNGARRGTVTELLVRAHAPTAKPRRSK